MDYYSKYLKYKAKYLELKSQLGRGGPGGSGSFSSSSGSSPNPTESRGKCNLTIRLLTDLGSTSRECYCKKYTSDNKTNICNTQTRIRTQNGIQTVICGHSKEDHQLLK